jgi:uncharacterized protein YdhG (YjbR/CyaY superfamily)
VPSVIDAYLGPLDERARAALERVRRSVSTRVPDASEHFEWGLAMLRWEGRPILGFAALEEHLSCYVTETTIAALGERLSGFSHSGGSIHFRPDDEIPDALLGEILSIRLASIGYGAAPSTGGGAT